jgi:Cytochrome c552
MAAMLDGSVQVGCLSPCHGFNGVITQFQSSVHYSAYLMNLGTAQATEWTAPGSACGNCHAIDGLQQRVNGTVGTKDDGGVANLSGGELNYRDPVTGAQSSATYLGSASVAEVYCTTCHAVTDANDPHKTGLPWTPGSFPLQFPDDAGSVFLEKSPTTAAITGTDAGNYGGGNTCMTCHRSREDVTNYLLPTGNPITSVYWGPHEGPQADIFTGQGGYQYPGMTYGEATHEQKLSCIDCHMVGVADNSGVPDHSFNPQLSACLGCHAGTTTFNINSFQSDVQSAMNQFETYFQNMLTRSATAPYTPLLMTQIGDGNWANDLPIPGSTIGGALMTEAQAGALYNYLLIARGSGYGVHNPKYVAQLLEDSYAALTTAPLNAFPPPRTQ